MRCAHLPEVAQRAGAGAEVEIGVEVFHAFDFAVVVGFFGAAN